jgi:hypothetical protein
MENLRQMLYQYDPSISLYIGNRFVILETPEGYMAGGILRVIFEQP